MKVIDIRLKEKEITILQSLIGRKLSAIKHDPFNYVNSSSQVVQIETEDGSVYLYSFTEPLDYFGTIEDVAVWTFEEKRYSFVDQKELVRTPFETTIRGVEIVQENQRLFERGKQVYDVWLTRGIIFNFEDRQLSLEKAVWFSEDIYIQRGYDLSKKFSKVEAFINSDWNEGIVAECSRETIALENNCN